MDMTGLLEVAIGMTLVYLGASLFVTIFNEYLAQILQLRGRQLARDLKMLIDDDDLKKALTISPALQPFFEKAGYTVDLVPFSFSTLPGRFGGFTVGVLVPAE